MQVNDPDDILLNLVATCGEISGKKVFQKLCYFLQEAEGVPLGVRFQMKHYGPFSEDLDDELEDLAERGFLIIDDRRDEGFLIRPGLKIESSDVAVRQIENLMAKLGDQLHHGLALELLATAHFLAVRQRYDGSEADKGELVKRVKARKGTKFQDFYIRENIETLEKLGYLPAA